MKKLILFLATIFGFISCEAQRMPLPNVSPSVRAVQQQPNITQVRPGYNFTDLVLQNTTNGDIPFVVQYPNSSYKSDVASGNSANISPNADCILIIPDGSFSLSKNSHYVLYINQNKKVGVKRVYPYP